MNWLDIIIVIFLFFSLIGGLRTGLISSALGFAGLIIGITLAGRFYVPFARWMVIIPWETAAKVIAFALILVAVMVAAAIIGKILTAIAKTIMLGWLNHLGGAVLGLATGAIFVGVVLAIWARFFGMPEVITRSFFSNWLLDRLPMVLALLPAEFDTIRNFFR